MRGAVTFCLGVEKNQIPGFDVRRFDRLADFVLLFHDPRYRNPVLREHVLDEPAAIESRRVRTAQPIRHAPESHCELRDRPPVVAGASQVWRGGHEGFGLARRRV
jgi:hypothetical protein